MGIWDISGPAAGIACCWRDHFFELRGSVGPNWDSPSLFSIPSCYNLDKKGGVFIMDVFAQRVRTAAVAGWWTLLIGAVFLVVQWVAYLVFMSIRPGWLLSLWGPEASWPFVQSVWFWATAIFKLFMWIVALVVVWVTLWARQLRKITP